MVVAAAAASVAAVVLMSPTLYAVGVRMLDGARQAARGVCPSIPVSASIGTTTLRPSDDAAEVIRRVDEQLYAAKRAGGDRISTI